MRARRALSAASRWTATSSLFGKDMHSLDAGLPYPYNAPDEKVLGLAAHPASAFATAFQEAQMTTALRTQLGDHWPLATEGAAAQRRGGKKRGVVGSGSQKTDETRDRDVQEGESMLEHLFSYTNGHTILRGEILNITTAGCDMVHDHQPAYIHDVHARTAPRSSWKLREEILRVGGPTFRPMFNDFRPMKYLRVVLNEALPPLPLNERHVLLPHISYHLLNLELC
ncbi:hypothetical protein K438DRAFT_584125 [Mycena galopus ATCC 62051]|nr:hypothetical protein K438DRAFT_584125 [Mycena galopus ATCC 62051]